MNPVEATVSLDQLDPHPSVLPALKPMARKPTGRRTNDLLLVAWLHGSFQATVFRRSVAGATWSSPVPVLTLPELEVALDTALESLKFNGVEVSIVLEHSLFVHQVEHAPAFSESASRAYLRGRVERYEKEHEPMLWITQRTVSARNESTFVLHLLPRTFYDQLTALLQLRRLELARILPLAVPLRQVIAAGSIPKDQPVLVAAQAGDAIVAMVGGADGSLLFARTLLARWETDGTRIGVEVNRSLLYAKQQFGVVVSHLCLLGEVPAQASAEIQARCGAGKQVEVRPLSTLDLLQVVARLSPRHPVNLVAGQIGQKRRQQFIRRSLMAACWLGLGVLALDSWSRALNWHEDEKRLHGLRANESALHASRERLAKRNSEAEQRRDLVRQVVDERVPAMPPRFMTYLGTSLPTTVRLTDLSIKRDETSRNWGFRLEGLIEGDDDTARETLVKLQKSLVKSALHARFGDGSGILLPSVAGPAAAAEGSLSMRFILEGSLLEK